MDNFLIYGLFSLVPSLFGGGIFIFYRYNKRLKKAEVISKEIESMQMVISSLTAEVERVKADNEKMHLLLNEKNERLSILYRQIEDQNLKMHMYVTCTQQAVSCTHARNCPVIRCMNHEEFS